MSLFTLIKKKVHPSGTSGQTADETPTTPPMLESDEAAISSLSAEETPSDIGSDSVSAPSSRNARQGRVLKALCCCCRADAAVDSADTVSAAAGSTLVGSAHTVSADGATASSGATGMNDNVSADDDDEAAVSPASTEASTVPVTARLCDAVSADNSAVTADEPATAPPMPESDEAAVSSPSAGKTPSAMSRNDSM
ncbi:uncharacterized protein LOC144532459 [Sander vitreus]